MTGDFLTRPLPIERFGLIYASAQKTLAIAGLTIVIVHEDLLGRGRRGIPAPFDLSRQAAAGSKVNTPPTFSVLVASRMLRWLVESGGLEAAAARSRKMSAKVYDAIDRSGFYRCPVSPNDRSLVNVCFRLPELALEEAFLVEAEANGLLHMRGHARVGGLRASLYSSTPEAAVDALIDFMARFQARRG
jgi:phosphoserine aminotransferase